MNAGLAAGRVTVPDESVKGLIALRGCKLQAANVIGGGSTGRIHRPSLEPLLTWSPPQASGKMGVTSIDYYVTNSDAPGRA